MNEMDSCDALGEQFDADALLVSMSDLQGRVTYASESLARASGCAAEDLVGQPHSVMRHPEVPARVFADLWTTVQAGQAWMGVIKNRAADGSGYWVRLSVTPVLEAGQVKAYLGVSIAATAQEISNAEKLFKRLRTFRAGAGHFERGRWQATGGSAAWRRRLGGSLQAQFNLMLGIFLVAAALALFLTNGLGVDLWACVAGLGFVALSLRVSFRRLIVRPMRVLIEGAQEVAAGAVRMRFGVEKGSSEIGQLARAIEQLTMSLMGVLSEVRSEAVAIHDTTEQVAQGGVHLSDRTEQQAANLEQTSAAMQQFSQSTSDNAYATAQASGIAMTMSDQARAGGKAVHRVVETMRELEVSSRRIGDIIGVIDGIAFRTNILALNAAVEAGRAGTEGRGFAVVAGEVRSLAQRSATAAREIKVLIEESVRRVDAAVGIVHNAGVAMDQTVDSVGKVSRLIEEISAATGGQATEIAQVTAAVRQLDEMTQQNAALVEQSAAAAETLKQQAGRLVGLADVFKMSATS